jgi:hypothetical protein
MENVLQNSSIVEFDDFGPDPILLRKRGISRKISGKFEIYKKRINNPFYVDYAINKIALELTHFLSK